MLRAERNNEVGDAPAISIRNLTKEYGGGEGSVLAVDDVSLDIDHGSTVGLLGPNGAGKTTTMKSVLGLTAPTDGEITVGGVDVGSGSKEIYRYVSGMLEGARNIYWRLTVRENVHFFARLNESNPADHAEAFDRLLTDLDLEDKADTQVNELSRGMQQKVSLACTLVRRTPVVLLDEPTLGLDVETTRYLCRSLNRLSEDHSTTVVLSSHDMSVIEEVCDRVVIMRSGKIVVDDDVENLLEGFQKQAFRITIDDGADVSTTLLDEFSTSGFEVNDGRATFEVTTTPSDLARVLDAVEADGHEVVSLESVDPNLEDVFLEVTEGDVATAGSGGISEVSASE